MGRRLLSKHLKKIRQGAMYISGKTTSQEEETISAKVLKLEVLGKFEDSRKFMSVRENEL